MLPTLTQRFSQCRNKPGGTKKYVKLTIFFLITLYLAMSPYTFYRLEFMPEKYDATAYSIANKLEHEDVHIDLPAPSPNGSKLHGWYFPCPGAKYTVIIHHGQSNNVAFYFPAAQVFRNCGAAVLLYDYEGFGLSSGKPSNQALRRDAEAAYFFIRNNKKTPADRIVHCGLSLGTGPACDIAARQPCAGIFLVSPYKRLSLVGKHLIPFLNLYPDLLFPQPDLGADQLVAQKAIPILIAHSPGDPVIPFEQARQIFEKARGPKLFYSVNSGGHLGGLAEGVEPLCKKWLSGL